MMRKLLLKKRRKKMRKLLQPHIDKIQSWNRKRKYKQEKYFKVAVGVTSNGILPIELLKGPFAGIIYSYGTINIGEDLGHMGARASFDIEIIRGFENVIADPKFCKIAGDILLLMLDKAIMTQAEKFIGGNTEDEEIGEDYIEEPVPQRTVRAKDSAISKKRVSSGSKRKNSVRGSSKVRPPIQRDTDI